MNVYFTSNVIVSLRPDMFPPDLIVYRRVSDDEAISWDHERTSSLSFGEIARCLELEFMRFHGEGGVTAVVPLRHCRDGIDFSTVHFVRERIRAPRLTRATGVGYPSQISLPAASARGSCARELATAHASARRPLGHITSTQRAIPANLKLGSQTNPKAYRTFPT